MGRIGNLLYERDQWLLPHLEDTIIRATGESNRQHNTTAKRQQQQPTRPRQSKSLDSTPHDSTPIHPIPSLPERIPAKAHQNPPPEELHQDAERRATHKITQVTPKNTSFADSAQFQTPATSDNINSALRRDVDNMIENMDQRELSFKEFAEELDGLATKDGKFVDCGQNDTEELDDSMKSHAPNSVLKEAIWKDNEKKANKSWDASTVSALNLTSEFKPSEDEDDDKSMKSHGTTTPTATNATYASVVQGHGHNTSQSEESEDEAVNHRRLTKLTRTKTMPSPFDSSDSDDDTAPAAQTAKLEYSSPQIETEHSVAPILTQLVPKPESSHQSDKDNLDPNDDNSRQSKGSFPSPSFGASDSDDDSCQSNGKHKNSEDAAVSRTHTPPPPKAPPEPGSAALRTRSKRGGQPPSPPLPLPLQRTQNSKKKNSQRNKQTSIVKFTSPTGRDET